MYQQCIIYLVEYYRAEIDAHTSNSSTPTHSAVRYSPAYLTHRSTRHLLSVAPLSDASSFFFLHSRGQNQAGQPQCRLHSPNTLRRIGCISS
eukprot:m.32867 g.32867  ORF g.32867 m.32867 type:complete len:92 (+) comp9559_c0_seq1:287-562(+)